MSSSASCPKLSVEQMGNRPVLQEAYGFLAMQEALRWMFYKDSQNQKRTFLFEASSERSSLRQ